jgi:transcriptional regulator with XRE-family HTH domain
MDITERIKQIMKEQDITQMELASRVGKSRQSVFDMISRANPNFKTVVKVFAALGYDIEIRRKDGKPTDIDEDALKNVLIEEEPSYGKLEAIMDVLGYKIEFVKKQ